MLHLPRVLLAAPGSDSGKTMITCGMLEAYRKRGKAPAAFKCGPDYIDPQFHEVATGAPGRNLDSFFTGPEVTRHLFARTARNAGISLIEGDMGFFDGIGGMDVQASSYDLARITETPVILIVNARGMSLSVIPMIKGYLDYQKQFGAEPIRGVILNQVNQSTYQLLKETVERQTGIRLYGYVPRLEDAVIESRHLGLVLPGEIAGLKKRLGNLAGELEHCLDLDAIAALAETAADYDDEALRLPDKVADLIPAKAGPAHPRIAVAKDEAFSFYYRDNLDLLEILGAELVPFSPLHDETLPKDISGLILGGGYPELAASQLNANEKMRSSIRERISSGLPYLAECGGFMYLQDQTEDMEGRSFPMCGCIPGKCYRTKKLGRFGYITLHAQKAKSSDPIGFLGPGEQIRGHEFHYFDSSDAGTDFEAVKPGGTRHWACLHAGEHSLAGFPHLHYWSEPKFAARFLDSAERCARRMPGTGEEEWKSRN